MAEKHPEFPYEDIINMSRPVSARKTKMSQHDRAAQFSPFAALTGYEDAITETARLTEGQKELTEGEKARLDARLRYLVSNNVSGCEVEILYFREDSLKQGGAYVTAAGTVSKIDPYHQMVLMSDGIRIPMDDIYCISGDLFRDSEFDAYM